RFDQKSRMERRDRAAIKNTAGERAAGHVGDAENDNAVAGHCSDGAVVADVSRRQRGTDVLNLYPRRCRNLGCVDDVAVERAAGGGHPRDPQANTIRRTDRPRLMMLPAKVAPNALATLETTMPPTTVTVLMAPLLLMLPEKT